MPRSKGPCSHINQVILLELIKLWLHTHHLPCDSRSPVRDDVGFDGHPQRTVRCVARVEDSWVPDGARAVVPVLPKGRGRVVEGLGQLIALVGAQTARPGASAAAAGREVRRRQRNAAATRNQLEVCGCRPDQV